MADPAQEVPVITEEMFELADSISDAMLRLPFPVKDIKPAYISKEQYSHVIELVASLTAKQRSKQKFTLMMPNGQKLSFRADALNPRFIFRVEGSSVTYVAEESTGISLRLILERIEANLTGNHTSRPWRIGVPTAPGSPPAAEALVGRRSGRRTVVSPVRSDRDLSEPSVARTVIES